MQDLSRGSRVGQGGGQAVPGGSRGSRFWGGEKTAKNTKNQKKLGCIHTSIRPYIHTSIHPYIHTCIHAYTDRYIDIYIHIYMLPPHAPTFSYLYRKIPTKNRLSWAGGEATSTFQLSGPDFSNFKLSSFPTFQHSNFPIFQFFWA